MPFMAAVPLITAGAGLLGKIFGGGAKGAADQRNSQNDAQARHNALMASLYNTRQGAELSARGMQDRGAVDRYQTRQGATTSALNSEEAGRLNRARLGLEAPSVRARQSLLGSMMENMQPVTVSNMNPRLAGRVPQINGGLTPAMLSDTTRAHGRDLQRMAFEAQRTGSDIPAMTDFRGGILDAPALQPYQQSGRLEKTLGGGGLLGTVLSEIDDLINERRGR